MTRRSPCHAGRELRSSSGWGPSPSPDTTKTCERVLVSGTPALHTPTAHQSNLHNSGRRGSIAPLLLGYAWQVSRLEDPRRAGSRGEDRYGGRAPPLGHHQGTMVLPMSFKVGNSSRASTRAFVPLAHYFSTRLRGGGVLNLMLQPHCGCARKC